MNFRASATKRPAEVAYMFDFVAPRYDFMNTLLSFGHVAQWHVATATALHVQAGE
ncbi:MAG: class I SAM-dependent methyltransferase, partial [Micrococcales bacterium]|nr:class I SAM-dependent methyltransferase [Micrococcales bacterium]